MDTPRKSDSAPLIAVATLVVVISGYAGWYYWTVKPIKKSGWTDSNLTPLGEFIFAPIHYLDRRIRPHVWEPTP